MKKRSNEIPQPQNADERRLLAEFQAKPRRERRAILATMRGKLAKQAHQRKVTEARVRKYLARPDVQQVMRAAQQAQQAQQAADDGDPS